MTEPRKGYSMREKKDILQFIIDQNAFYQVKGQLLWTNCASSLDTTRTWQSLKEAFIKRIYPDLNNSYYGLTSEQVALFRKGFTNSKTNDSQITSWLQKGPKSNKLDSGKSNISSHAKQGSPTNVKGKKTMNTINLEPVNTLNLSNVSNGNTHNVLDMSDELLFESPDESNNKDAVPYNPALKQRTSPSILPQNNSNLYDTSPAKNTDVDDSNNQSKHSDIALHSNSSVNVSGNIPIDKQPAMIRNLQSSILLLSSSEPSVDKHQSDSKQKKNDLFGCQDGNYISKRTYIPIQNLNNLKIEDPSENNGRLSPIYFERRKKRSRVRKYSTDSSSSSSSYDNVTCSDSSDSSKNSHRTYTSKRNAKRLPQYGLLNGKMIPLHYKREHHKYRHSKKYVRNSYERNSTYKSDMEHNKKYHKRSKDNRDEAVVLTPENERRFYRDLRRYHDGHRIGPKPKIHNYYREAPNNLKGAVRDDMKHRLLQKHSDFLDLHQNVKEVLKFSEKHSQRVFDFPNHVIRTQYYEDLERYYRNGKIGTKPNKQNYQRVLTKAEQNVLTKEKQGDTIGGVIINQPIYIEDDDSEECTACTPNLQNTPCMHLNSLKPSLSGPAQILGMNIINDTIADAETFWRMKYLLEKNRRFESSVNSTAQSVVGQTENKDDKAVQVSEVIIVSDNQNDALSNKAVTLNTSKEHNVPNKRDVSNDSAKKSLDGNEKYNKLEIAISKHGEKPINRVLAIHTQGADSLLDLLQLIQKKTEGDISKDDEMPDQKKGATELDKMNGTELNTEKVISIDDEMPDQKKDSTELDKLNGTQLDKEKVIFDAILAENFNENDHIPTERNIFSSYEVKLLLGENTDNIKRENVTTDDKEQPTQIKKTKVEPERKSLPRRASKNISPTQPQRKNYLRKSNQMLLHLQQKGRDPTLLTGSSHDEDSTSPKRSLRVRSKPDDLKESTMEIVGRGLRSLNNSNANSPKLLSPSKSPMKPLKGTKRTDTSSLNPKLKIVKTNHRAASDDEMASSESSLNIDISDIDEDARFKLNSKYKPNISRKTEEDKIKSKHFHSKASSSSGRESQDSSPKRAKRYRRLNRTKKRTPGHPTQLTKTQPKINTQQSDNEEILSTEPESPNTLLKKTQLREKNDEMENLTEEQPKDSEPSSNAEATTTRRGRPRGLRRQSKYRSTLQRRARLHRKGISKYKEMEDHTLLQTKPSDLDVNIDVSSSTCIVPNEENLNVTSSQITNDEKNQQTVDNILTQCPIEKKTINSKKNISLECSNTTSVQTVPLLQSDLLMVNSGIKDNKMIICDYNFEKDSNIKNLRMEDVCFSQMSSCSEINSEIIPPPCTECDISDDICKTENINLTVHNEVLEDSQDQIIAEDALSGNTIYESLQNNDDAINQDCKTDINLEESSKDECNCSTPNDILEIFSTPDPQNESIVEKNILAIPELKTECLDISVSESGSIKHGDDIAERVTAGTSEPWSDIMTEEDEC